MGDLFLNMTASGQTGVDKGCGDMHKAPNLLHPLRQKHHLLLRLQGQTTELYTFRSFPTNAMQCMHPTM